MPNLKLCLFTVAMAALAACGGSDSPSSNEGGAGGTGGAGADGGTTITGLGGTGGTTASTTSSSSTCTILGAVPCGPNDPDAYPDDTKSYAVGLPFHGFLQAIPGYEVGDGAAVVQLGPWATDVGIKSVSVHSGPVTSDPVRLALWSEALCGLPQDAPSEHVTSVPLAKLAQEPADGGATKLTWTPDVPFGVKAGTPVFLAYLLTNTGDSIAIYDPNGAFAPRAMWFGIVDNNCDGVIDAQLGAAYLDSPTAPGVEPYHYDEAFEVELTAAP